MRFKHYSFDLWLTLIRSNPEFKSRRAQYFFDRFNHKQKSADEVRAIFRNTDVMCNRVNELTGKNIDFDEMYLMIVAAMNDYEVDLSTVLVDEIYKDLEDLFFEFHPVLFDEQTRPTLENLSQSASLNILSNTGFIKGTTLSRLLEQLGIAQYFDFQLYSDEKRISKPNPAFFQSMLEQVPEGISLEEVVHVGDNPRADVKGAEAMGIHAFQINSNEYRIQDLL